MKCKCISLNLILLFSFISFLIITKQNYTTEIIITIKGQGNQLILSEDSQCNKVYSFFDILPDEILIENKQFSISKTINISSNRSENNVTLRWNKKLNKTSNMFSNLINITNIYFTKFDTSEVTDMKCMFFKCIGITSLELSKFNTSLVKDMGGMFSDCEKLAKLDFSSFDTSLVTNMHHMIYQCYELTSINFKNFRTSNVVNMTGMFENSTSLTSLNLKNFDTSSVVSMYAMFHMCRKITSLDLSHFNTSKVNDMRIMFSECDLLTILNIKNFDTSKISVYQDKEKIFSLTSNIKYYCLNIQSNKISLPSSENNCSYFDYLEQRKKYIKEKDEWIDDCSMDDTYIFEYNKTCYQICPKRTYNSSGNICIDLNCISYYNYDLTGCIEEIPEGYYNNDTTLKTIDKCNIKCKNCESKDLCLSCNTNNSYFPVLNNTSNNSAYAQCYNNTPEGYILDNDTYKPCYHTCKACYLIGDEKNNKCFECIKNYKFINNETLNNCYEICDYLYYFDSDGKYSCTTENSCPNGYKLINDKNKCIRNCSSDNLYRYEYDNICYKTCPNNTNSSLKDEFICKKIILNEFEITTNIDEYKSIYTNTIKKGNDEGCQPIDFFNGLCPVNSDNISIFSRDEMIEKIKNGIQNGTMDKLISNVLGGDKNDYIIKDDNMIYQITSTDNQNKNQNNNISTIILGQCEKILKKEYNISEDLSLLIFKIDYFKQGSSIPIIGYEIYHPITKIKLDLKYCNNANININIPVSINEDNLLKYDPNNEYYTNECTPSTTENGTDILLNDRQDEFNNNNMFLCEQNCTYNGYNNKTASCECGVKLQQIVISEIVDENNVVTYNFTNKNDMITMKCYQTLFSKDGLIKNIGNYIMLFIVLLIMTSSILFYKCGYYFLEEKINEIINKKEKINNKISKCETIDIQQNQIKQKDKKNKKGKKKSGKNLRIKQTKSVKKIKSKNKIDVSNSNSFSKLEINTKSSSKNDKEKKKNQFNKSLDNLGLNENNIDFYKDFDLNSFTYNEAKKYDKRKLVSFYISLLKTKHPISFSFLPIDDYNSLIIKIDLFFISLSLYYFINSLFFDQSIIHKIYKDAGIYNLKYLIPYIIYSCIISHTLYVITKYIFLSERNLHEIAVEKNFEKASSIAYQTKRKLSIKYICFFVAFTVIDSFIWYYLSSFGAVYQNTQVFIIENTMISLCFSLVFPFVYYLLPSFLRINSLKSKDGELLYKISKVAQFV